MIPSGQAGINTHERLKEADRKPTETLLEIARPVDPKTFSNPYDEYWLDEYESEIQEKHTGDLDE
jgi:hypothetical protein